MNLFALATFASFGINCHASFIRAGELNVTPESNTGVGGFMFDVEANQVMDVTIDTILFNFNAGKGSYEYGLWYKEGSFIGFNTDESAWTPACSGNSIEQARLSDFNSATTKSDCSFTIPAGETYGVYIHGLSRGLIVEEEGSSFDDVVASDDDIKVYTGLAIASTYGPFGEGYGDDYYVTPTVKLMYTALFNDENDCVKTFGSLDVLNIEYGVFREGTYFGFDVEALDAILGRSDWDKEILVVNGRQVVVWRNGHGRYEPRVAAKKGDWSVGDTIEFSNAYCPQSDEEEDDCSIDVLSVDHKFGPSVVGKYFNFDKDALDTILGRSDWSNERLGTDKGTVVVWRNPNGGSVGDAHGRFDQSAKKGDWSVGDEITFLDCSMR